MRFGFKLFVIAAMSIGVLAFGAAKVAYTGAGPLDQAKTVEIPSGSGLSSIAARLEREGVISSASLFKLAAAATGVDASLRAGDYAFEPGSSMEAVLGALVEGASIDYRVTVAEGLTSKQVVALVEANEVLTGEIAETPAEGSLAPNTYFVRRGETRQAVIDRMQEAQAEILAELWESRAEDLPIDTPEEALILASIVEKETGVAGERPEVASVFVNRLRRGMKLESDPTIIYGITLGEGPLGRGIRRSEIRAETPWNTYVIDRLPPTPIANPGRAAIAATLNPAETPYIFFVASGDGGHTFSETYEQHRAAVARWREIERERAAAAEATDG